MWVKLAVVALALVAVRFIYNIIQNRQLAYKAAQLGCEKAPPFVTPWWDPFGLTPIYSMLKAQYEGTLTEYIEQGFEQTSQQAGRRVTVVSGDIAVGNLLLTRDPKAIQTLLATGFKDYELDRNRLETFKGLLGNGIFSTNGTKWAHSRAMLKPAFNKSQVSDLDVEYKHSQNLMRALPTDETGWTAPTDLQPLFFRLTIDSSTEFLFGESVDSQLHELPAHLKPAGLREPKTKAEKVFAKAFDKAQEGLAKKLILQDLYWLYTPMGTSEAVRNCHEFIDFYVRRALDPNTEKTAKEDKYVFLDELAKETRDPLQLRYELINVLLAGRDTTASLLGFLFSLLARKPAEFHKLRAAVLDHFGTYEDSQEISFATLKNCQQLQYCLNESLRLYPSVPINFRMANKDTTLPVGGGPTGLAPVFVPKGTNVLYSVAVMHRDKELWGQDANEFKPERWIARSTSWSYLPFNGGPRICLGQQFALTSAGFVVVKLMQRFDNIQNLDPGKILEHQTLTACPKNGVKVRLHEAVKA